MLPRFWIGVASVMAVGAVAFFLGQGVVEAHATGYWHWHWVEAGWMNATACLYSPSGALMYCY